MAHTGPLAAAIVAAGPDGLDTLPAPDRLAALPAPERNALLDKLRPELYAMAAIVADATMQRADLARPAYPPYGLARSFFTELRMVAHSPRPFEAGSVTTFHALGCALLDTMVFHLDAELTGTRASEQRWRTDRLEHLLALFRVGAGPAGRARVRDGYSFLYGGLHFGTSVCVQVVEVMSRVLASRAPSVPPAGRAEIIGRSVRAVLQLTALNVDGVARAYQQLQSPTEGPAPHSTASATRWLAAEHFVIHAPGGRIRRVDLAKAVAGPERGTYTTIGCPARMSLGPPGAPSAVARLWRWSVELAEATGLLGLSTGWSPERSS